MKNNLSLIDGHAHLIWPTLWKKIHEVLERAKDAQIEFIINIGVKLDDFQKCLELKQLSPRIINVIGLHPTEGLDEIEKIEEFKKKFRDLQHNFAAIGEIGLDYYEIHDQPRRDLQEILFRAQLDLAVELKKPVVIHCRNSEKQAIKILEEGQYHSIPRVLLHCFGGAEKFINIALSHKNWFFTIPTSVVYKKLHQRLCKKVPLSRIILETDSPFLSPLKNGNLNEPKNVWLSANKIADLKQVTLKDVAIQTTSDAKIFFQLV